MKKIVALVLCLALVLALGTVAFAADGVEYVKDVYVKSTDVAGAAVVKGDVTYFAATETKDKDGKVVSGTSAYYTTTATGETKLTLVNSLAEADFVAYWDEAGKQVALYLAKADYVEYNVATVVTNLGDKCGQYDKTGFTAGKTYYKDADSKIYEAADKGAKTLLVDGKLVKADLKADLQLRTITHAAIPVLGSKGIEGYKCSKCGLAAVKAPNFMSIPAKATQETLSGNWYWPVSGAAATTAGVTSAKTFDAGVAMYAGLALMSVAGSAVVIGKKKEF